MAEYLRLIRYGQCLYLMYLVIPVLLHLYNKSIHNMNTVNPQYHFTKHKLSNIMQF